MRVERIKYENLKEDGTFDNEPGAVGTKPRIFASEDHGKTCECGCSDGHWITVNAGRDADTRTMELVQFRFDSADEKHEFLREFKSNLGLVSE